MFKDAGLKDKIALVTGGARGIGCEIVKQFANEGAQVYFFYNYSEDAAKSLVAEAEKQGQHITALKVDVTNKAQVDAAIEQVCNATNRLDILVNNSGVVRDGLLAGLSEQDIQTVINTNLIGTFNVTQAVVPWLMRQRAGKIINISSVAGEKGGRGQTNYAASKGAINAFTKALAVELAPRKIQVNAVAPGVIETEMSKNVRELGGEEVINEILLRRYGQPQEVAYLVTFLASKYADYITGQVFHIDGGFKMA